MIRKNSLLKPAPPKPPHKRTRMAYYWWRRFGTHKDLSKNCHYSRKIENGDYDYSPYFIQANWEFDYMEEECNQFKELFKGIEYTGMHNDIAEIEKKYYKRVNKLNEDGLRDESIRLEKLAKDLKSYFGGTLEEAWEFMETYDKGVDTIFLDYALHKGYNKNSIKFIK